MNPRKSIDPLVSIIAVAYNDEKTIEACIESLVLQDYARKEIIVVSDLGSKDRTVDLVRELGRRHPLKIIEVEHTKRSPARNIGIKHSKGNIVTFVETDGVFDSSYLSKLIVHFKKPEVGGVNGHLHVLNLEHFLPRCLSKEREIFELRQDNTFSAWTYRKNILESVDGFDEELECAEDRDLAHRVKRLGFKILYEPEAHWWHTVPKNFWEFAEKSYWHGRERSPYYAKYPDEIPKIRIVIFLGFLSLLWGALLDLALLRITIIAVFLLIIADLVILVLANPKILLEFECILMLPILGIIRNVAFVTGLILSGLSYLKNKLK